MHDLDDLRIFARVATLKSFSVAANALSLPNSTVSRAVARLESRLGVRLIQRTMRDLSLTSAGQALLARSGGPLADLADAIDYVSGLGAIPKGPLRISCGIAWGYHVLAHQILAFTREYPLIDLQIDVISRFSELISDRVDVAIRMGPIPDSTLVGVRLGSMSRLLCASPSYLEKMPPPREPRDLATHDLVEMPSVSGRMRTLNFSRAGQRSEVEIRPRIEVNDAVTIHRLVQAGVAAGVISNYLCVDDVSCGRLVQLLPEWALPPLDISLVFPSRNELSPAVRAFVNLEGPPGVSQSRRLFISLEAKGGEAVTAVISSLRRGPGQNLQLWQRALTPASREISDFHAARAAVQGGGNARAAPSQGALIGTRACS